MIGKICLNLLMILLLSREVSKITVKIPCFFCTEHFGFAKTNSCNSFLCNNISTMEHQHHPDLIAEARRHMEGIISFMQKSTETVRWDQENENVLDYGCGNGRNTLRLLLPQIEKTGSKLYAVDVDEGKVEEAKINCAHPSATYAVGNILGEFPFKNIKFDKVFSFYVLNYIPDIK